jgi:hypothetical protein
VAHRFYFRHRMTISAFHFVRPCWPRRIDARYSVGMAQPPESPSVEPAPDVFPPGESADGVDLTLIQWTLSLTPLERLELLQDWVDGLTELRHGRVEER